MSTQMPGQKDCKSVKLTDGSKEVLQKKLLLKNLNEIYQCFKEANPSIKIGLSKFCELRPPQCQSAGDAGTHTVCVCSLHENMNLLLAGKHSFF